MLSKYSRAIRQDLGLDPKAIGGILLEGFASRVGTCLGLKPESMEPINGDSTIRLVGFAVGPWRLELVAFKQFTDIFFEAWSVSDDPESACVEESMKHFADSFIDPEDFLHKLMLRGLNPAVDGLFQSYIFDGLRVPPLFPKLFHKEMGSEHVERRKFMAWMICTYQVFLLHHAQEVLHYWRLEEDKEVKLILAFAFWSALELDIHNSWNDIYNQSNEMRTLLGSLKGTNLDPFPGQPVHLDDWRDAEARIASEEANDTH